MVFLFMMTRLIHALTSIEVEHSNHKSPKSCYPEHTSPAPCNKTFVVFVPVNMPPAPPLKHPSNCKHPQTTPTNNPPFSNKTKNLCHNYFVCMAMDAVGWGGDYSYNISKVRWYKMSASTLPLPPSGRKP